MATKRIVAIVGATGAQGGGLARAILRDAASGFTVRALTRHPESPKARSLAALGADVVAADSDDIESLKRAFAGAYGAYCVTNFWEHGAPERELTQAASMAEASRCAGLQHVIWSTLEDTRRLIPLTDDRMPTLMGKYKVPHFDAKGEANGLFERLGAPTTFLLTSFYWDNLLHFPGMGLRTGADGQLAIAMPMGDKKLPGIAADDIGRCAFGILKEGRRFIGQTIGIAGEHLTGNQMASALTKALGRDVRYTDVSPRVYRTWDFPGAAELCNMLQFKRDFEQVYCDARSVEQSRQLNPSLQTFERWLAGHTGQFEIPR
jgi:uncharacterized protein YbjT (DUF2867 family)